MNTNLSFNKEINSKIYSILFAILIIPNSYFYIINDISIAVIINPIIIFIAVYYVKVILPP